MGAEDGGRVEPGSTVDDLDARRRSTAREEEREPLAYRQCCVPYHVDDELGGEELRREQHVRPVDEPAEPANGQARLGGRVG
jgi:hypothetical protein